MFVCFAPYEDPEIVISMVVERGGSGRKLAAGRRRDVDYYFSAEHTDGIGRRREYPAPLKGADSIVRIPIPLTAGTPGTRRPYGAVPSGTRVTFTLRPPRAGGFSARQAHRLL